MAVEERDPHSGFMTTGHEWSGIKELNTPVPRAVYFFLIATFVFSLGYWLLMPTWPTGASFTKGLLGADDRKSIARSLEQAEQARAWSKKIESADFAAIQADPALMTIVRQSGRTLFGDNCAVCHGIDAKGSKGFPDLTAASTLWGGTPEAMMETIRVGINSGHGESRSAQMLAFGRDGMIPRADVENVTAFVQSLSAAPGSIDKARVEAGKAIYAANCAACHGDEGKGNAELGAPDLTDKAWIYGGDTQSIFNSVWHGRQGQMPAWENRLSPVDRKILALYLAELRKPGP
jgi:cytochrome c oxidase cbb3-type subunit 3